MKNRQKGHPSWWLIEERIELLTEQQIELLVENNWGRDKLATPVLTKELTKALISC